jgi:toxin FitB
MSEGISLLAADLSLVHSLLMADAVVYATALEADCKVVTSDAHFRKPDKVVFVE